MLERLNGETRLFPIIGDPIIYVKSPERLTSGFAARGHNGICVPMQVPDGDLESVMHGLTRIPNIDGVLVTMPHKFTAYTYCATSSERSRLLKVVSVMRRNADGSWHGDMLDGLAFVQAQKDQGAQPEGARVLLLGAGGAGSAIAITLLESGRPRTDHPRHECGSPRRTDGACGGRGPRPGDCRSSGPDGLRHGVQCDTAGYG